MPSPSPGHSRRWYLAAAVALAAVVAALNPSDPFFDELRGNPRFERINRGE